MNRQVVAFLSLFSLVLVLSIYYVVDASNDKAELVNKEENIEQIEVSTDKYYFSSLSLQRDEKHQELIDEQVSIIASNESDSLEVIKAKETIASIEEIMFLEEELENLILECDLVASYVEILEEEYIIKAYKPNINLEEELLLVDSIFYKIDTYVLENNVELIDNLNPIVELKI